MQASAVITALIHRLINVVNQKAASLSLFISPLIALRISAVINALIHRLISHHSFLQWPLCGSVLHCLESSCPELWPGIGQPTVFFGVAYFAPEYSGLENSSLE